MGSVPRTGILIRRRIFGHWDTGRRLCEDIYQKAEIGVIWLQGKEGWQLPDAGRGKKRSTSLLPLQDFRGSLPMPRFWTSSLHNWENTLLLFWATGFMALCYRGLRNEGGISRSSDQWVPWEVEGARARSLEIDCVSYHLSIWGQKKRTPVLLRRV